MIDENIDINKIVELRCKTTDYLGVGAIKKISDIAKDLKGRNIDKTLIVTGKDSYKISENMKSKSQNGCLIGLFPKKISYSLKYLK